MLKFVGKVLASFTICTVADIVLKAVQKPKKYPSKEACEILNDLPSDQLAAILTSLGYIPNPVPTNK